MCSQQAEAYCEEIVDEFISQLKQFTAKDITDEIKTRLKDSGLPFERHQELKNTVHKVCSAKMDSTWERSLVRLPGVPNEAFLYYPSGTNPQDYINGFSKPQVSQSKPLQALPNAIVAITTTVNQPKSVDPNKKSVNKYGRLIVSKRFLEPAGYSPGTSIFLYASGTSLYLSSVPPAAGSSRRVHVDNQGRIRLNRKTRELLSGVDADDFEISLSGQTIEVKPA